MPGWAVASLTGKGGASIQIFEGRAVTSATIDCWQGAVGAVCRYEATLSRLAVYIFDSGLAVVIVELSFATTVRQGETTRSLLLSDVETLLDRLGRLYAGRYEAGEPVEVPDNVRWTPSPDGVARFSPEDALRWLETHGEPPLADHWRELLGGGVAGMSGSLVPVPLLNGPRTPSSPSSASPIRRC